MRRPDPVSPRPGSLREALTEAGDLDGRFLLAADAAIPLGDLLTTSSLECEAGEIRGRNVLLATTDQLATAIALVGLDGAARRIVLCPPDLDAAHLPALAERAAIDTVVSDRPQSDFAVGKTARFVRCSQPSRFAAAAAPAPVSGHPTEWVLLTSGTTGIPKMAAHSFAALTGAIKPTAVDDAPSVWSTFYDIRRYGGLQIYLRGMLGRGSLVLSKTGEPVAAFLERLGRSKVTHLSGTPSHWRRALMSPALHAMTPRYVRLSGEIADQALLDNLRAAFPEAGLGHAYASTEAGVAFEVTDGREGFPASFIGVNDNGVELAIRDGSLRIRSARTASGYVESPDAALADTDGFVDTGDMVERRGERYDFVGRRGGIVNVGGLKVHPEEVETVLNAHARVRMSLVEARRNPITGAVVAASVVLNEEGAEDGVRADILAHCRRALPPHKVPAILRVVPGLEVSAAGKLLRRHG